MSKKYTTLLVDLPKSISIAVFAAFTSQEDMPLFRGLTKGQIILECPPYVSAECGELKQRIPSTTTINFCLKAMVTFAYKSVVYNQDKYDDIYFSGCIVSSVMLGDITVYLQFKSHIVENGFGSLALGLKPFQNFVCAYRPRVVLADGI